MDKKSRGPQNLKTDLGITVDREIFKRDTLDTFPQ